MYVVFNNWTWPIDYLHGIKVCVSGKAAQNQFNEVGSQHRKWNAPTLLKFTMCLEVHSIRDTQCASVMIWQGYAASDLIEACDDARIGFTFLKYQQLQYQISVS